MRNRRDKFSRAGEQSLLPYPLTKHSLINGVQVFRDFLNEKFCFFSPDSRRQEVPDTNYSALYPKVNYMWPNAQPPDHSTLYYTNASGDGVWENLQNWNTAADGSGDNPTEIPWTETDGSTSASNLLDATGGVGIAIGVYFSVTIAPNGDVTGVCDISHIYLSFDFENAFGGSIRGGTFTGNNFISMSGDISGGLFTGDNFDNENSYIHPITGGTFTGKNFLNDAFIFGGSFNIDGFVNRYGIIHYPNITINLDGVPYTGGWDGQNWIDGVWDSVA